MHTCRLSGASQAWRASVLSATIQCTSERSDRQACISCNTQTVCNIRQLKLILMYVLVRVAPNEEDTPQLTKASDLLKASLYDWCMTDVWNAQGNITVLFSATAIWLYSANRTDCNLGISSLRFGGENTVIFISPKLFITMKMKIHHSLNHKINSQLMLQSN